jgi:hypothetical protein
MARDGAHRAGHVEQHGDRERVGVLRAVPAFPLADVERVEARVHGARARIAVAERALAVAQAFRGFVYVG